MMSLYKHRSVRLNVLSIRGHSQQFHSDQNDADPLTPNHILTMRSSITLPPPGYFQRLDIYQRKRWRRVQHLANIFWSRSLEKGISYHATRTP